MIAADATGRPVSCPQQSEISALGAAILARALDEGGSLEQLCSKMTGVSREIQPGESAGHYAQQFRDYVESIHRFKEG